jgi:hypothetical protein
VSTNSEFIKLLGELEDFASQDCVKMVYIPPVTPVECVSMLVETYVPEIEKAQKYLKEKYDVELKWHLDLITNKVNRRILDFYIDPYYVEYVVRKANKPNDSIVYL